MELQECPLMLLSVLILMIRKLFFKCMFVGGYGTPEEYYGEKFVSNLSY
jgi:hypothetical protein